MQCSFQSLLLKVLDKRQKVIKVAVQNYYYKHLNYIIMGTTIIICGILFVVTILLGLFRLRWLRKCYDKARAEKRDILEREQMALADKLQKTYDKSKVAMLKYMVIAPVVIAILGTAVWGINRIVVAQKAEKELVKVEEQSKAKEEKSVSETKYSVKSLFYYFSYDGNLERFVANRKNKLDQAEAEYQAVVQKLDKAKRSGDMAKVTKYSIEYNDTAWRDYFGLYKCG